MKWFGVALVSGLLAGSTGVVDAQSAGGWSDPSPHRASMVKVQGDVALEVLDWGGEGPPLVLLAGLGNTAHVFDEFAPDAQKVVDTVRWEGPQGRSSTR